MAEPNNTEPVSELRDIMARLRSENGCPWDREQTLETLKPNLVEECYETVDAIDGGDVSEHREELGDLLLQVVFQARVREEQGEFDFDDVVETICDKLVRRHPHVFGESEVEDSKEVLQNWEAIKREEKGTQKKSSTFSGLPRSMPALQKASHIQQRAARLGFDWDSMEPVLEKIEEELNEAKEAIAGGDGEEAFDEIGDMLFAIVNLNRFMGTDAEEALHHTIAKFIRRFEHMEESFQMSGKSMQDSNLEELDESWEAAKRREREDESHADS